MKLGLYIKGLWEDKELLTPVQENLMKEEIKKIVIDAQSNITVEEQLKNAYHANNSFFKTFKYGKDDSKTLDYDAFRYFVGIYRLESHVYKYNKCNPIINSEQTEHDVFTFLVSDAKLRSLNFDQLTVKLNEKFTQLQTFYKTSSGKDFTEEDFKKLLILASLSSKLHNIDALAIIESLITKSFSHISYAPGTFSDLATPQKLAADLKLKVKTTQDLEYKIKVFNAIYPDPINNDYSKNDQYKKDKEYITNELFKSYISRLDNNRKSGIKFHYIQNHFAKYLEQLKFLDQGIKEKLDKEFYLNNKNSQAIYNNVRQIGFGFFALFFTILVLVINSKEKTLSNSMLITLITTNIMCALLNSLIELDNCRENNFLSDKYKKQAKDFSVLKQTALNVSPLHLHNLQAERHDIVFEDITVSNLVAEYASNYMKAFSNMVTFNLFTFAALRFAFEDVNKDIAPSIVIKVLDKINEATNSKIGLICYYLIPLVYAHFAVSYQYQLTNGVDFEKGKRTDGTDLSFVDRVAPTQLFKTAYENSFVR